MSALALVSRPACPIRTGDRVHVPEAVRLDSGRAVPPGHYDALAVERTPVEDAHLGRWRVVVEALPDCADLGRQFRRPTAEERRAGAEVPLCAQRSRLYLYPGQVTRYADGEGAVTIPDRRRAPDQ